jgi:TIR domain
MQIFLSYASEQRTIATSLAHRLRSNGYRVLYDASDIIPGESFDAKLQSLIARANLYIFIASEDSIRPGCYALSELSITERKWPNPADKVLTLIVDNLPIERLPAYLRSVSILTAKGDLIADVVSAVGALRRKNLRRMLSRTIITSIAIVSIGVGLRPLVSQKSSGPGPNKSPWFDGFELSAREGEYILSASLRNASDHHVTAISLFPEFESKDGRFPSSFEYATYEFIPAGESKTYSVKSYAKEGAHVPVGKWRACWQFVSTQEIFANLKNPDWQIAFYAQTQCSEYVENFRQ